MVLFQDYQANLFIYLFILELVRNELSSLFVGLMDSPFSDLLLWLVL